MSCQCSRRAAQSCCTCGSVSCSTILSNMKDIPGTSTSTDDSDGAASHTDEGGDVRDVDAQETKELGNSRIGGRPGAVAALEAASGALVGGRRGAVGGSCGSSKDRSDGEGGEGFELHGC